MCNWFPTEQWESTDSQDKITITTRLLLCQTLQSPRSRTAKNKIVTHNTMIHEYAHVLSIIQADPLKSSYVVFCLKPVSGLRVSICLSYFYPSCVILVTLVSCFISTTVSWINTFVLCSRWPWLWFPVLSYIFPVLMVPFNVSGI